MRKTKSEKTLCGGKASCFYKNFKLLRIQQQPRIKSKQKSITIQNSPWNCSINKQQIDYLIQRLNDTPASLYSAIQHQKSFDQLLFHKNKFKPLPNLIIHKKCNFQYMKSLNYLERLPKKNEIEKYRRLLKNLQVSKQKYEQQYRAMLLGMKSTCLDELPLPKIQYIQQNQFTEKLNKMNRFTKQKK